MAEPTTETIARSLTSQILSLQPSCIDFSKLVPDVFVVGTYELDEASAPAAGGEGLSLSPQQSRRGSVQLFRLENGRTATILQYHTTESAVLDLRFSLNRQEICAAATSTGAVALYKLSNLSGEVSLVPGKVFRAFDPGILVLSLAWNPSANPDLRNQAAVSLSDGSAAILDLGLSFELKKRIRAHEEEAWCLTWTKDKEVFLDAIEESSTAKPSLNSGQSVAPQKLLIGAGHFLFTGGDDHKIRAFDIECDSGDDELEEEIEPEDEPAQPTALSRWDDRTHSAGVTAIVLLTLRPRDVEEIALTGSYDEHIRVVMPTLGRRWKTLTELKLGGGVWKLDLLHTKHLDDGVQRILVLASCMHAGARIVEVKCDAQDEWSIEVLARFEEHESMCYASAAVPVHGSDGREFTVVSTSFYDKKLCVWRFAWD